MAHFAVGDAVRPAWSYIDHLGTGVITAVADDGVETPRYAVRWSRLDGTEDQIQHLETEIELVV